MSEPDIADIAQQLGDKLYQSAEIIQRLEGQMKNAAEIMQQYLKRRTLRNISRTRSWLRKNGYQDKI